MNPRKAFGVLELAIQQSGSGEHPARPLYSSISLACDVLLNWLDQQRSRYHREVFYGDANPAKMPDAAYGWLRVIGLDAKGGQCCRAPGVDRCLVSLRGFIDGRTTHEQSQSTA